VGDIKELGAVQLLPAPVTAVVIVPVDVNVSVREHGMPAPIPVNTFALLNATVRFDFPYKEFIDHEVPLVLLTPASVLTAASFMDTI